MEKLTNFYTPFRERISDIGVIAAGVALAAVSFFIRTDIFETILDYVGVLGMAAGITIAAVGIFMLGTEKGWWEKIMKSIKQSGNASVPRDDEGETSAEIETGAHASSEDVEPVQQPGNPAASGNASSVESRSRTAPRLAISRQIPGLLVILAILPVALLLVSTIAPWYSNEVEQVDRFGRWTGEDSTEYKTLWDGIETVREHEEGISFGLLGRVTAEVHWERPFASYLTTIIGSIVILVNLLVNLRNYRVEEDQVYKDRLQTLLLFSTFICALTMWEAYYAWDNGIPIVGLGGDLSFGPYLFLLGALSIVGYLAVLFIYFAGTTIGGMFDNFNLSTFVSFQGRITRPTFWLAIVSIYILSILWNIVFNAVLEPVLDFVPLPPLAQLLASLVILLVPIIWTLFAVCAKRCHDRGIPAWRVFAVFVALIFYVMQIPLIILLELDYSWVPSVPSTVYSWIVSDWWEAVNSIPLITLIIELGVVKGTTGANTYGPDLLAQEPTSGHGPGQNPNPA